MKKFLLMLFAAFMAGTMSLSARTVVIDEGFENGIQDDVWTQEFVMGNMPWAVESEDDLLSHPSSVHEGTHRAYLRNTTGETLGYKTRLVSKVMDLRPTKVYMPELTFWYASPKWGADCDTLRVLYRTSARGQWKQLGEYSRSVTQWQRVKIALPEVGQTYQIAFEGTDNLGHGIVLDEIKLQSAPECTVPYDLMVLNKGAGKVNLFWSASFDADNFEVIITRDTIDPDMVADIEENDADRIVFHELVSGDVTNCDLLLESGEFYLAYVRSICEDENSAWSSEQSKDGPFGFRVRVAKQIPFMENFNYPSNKNRDDDWAWGNNLPNNIVTPYVNSAATGNSRANYSPDTTSAVIFSGAFGSPSTFIPADRYVYVATPALADTLNENFHINQCQVHFWATVYTYTGRQYGRSIMVGVMEDPDDITTFRPVDTVSVWGNRTFQEFIVDLSSYEGNGSYLAFVSDFDRDNLFYLDNMTVEYRKAVNKVTKISVNPRDTYATISWEGNASSYNVLVTSAEVNPANPNPELVVDQATVSGTSYLCESLEPDHSWNSPYYVYVQAEGQEWSYRYPFVTIASLRDIPYAYDFEARTTTTRKIGNQQCVVGLGVFGNAGTYPAVNVGNSYGGSNSLFLSKRGGTDAWLTLPMVENLDSVQVKFYLSSGSNDIAQAHATIGIMSNPMDINTFVPVSSFTLNSTGYTRCYANFENYSGPEGVIAIVWDDVKNMTANTINYIDEITVDTLSECVPPTNIELQVEPDAVTVKWESSALSSEWELFLSRTPLSETQRVHKTKEQIAAIGGVVLDTTLTWTDPQNPPTFYFDELVQHSNYYLYVRATCDMEWWSEMAFSTPCQEETFPYKETFEDYNPGSQSAGCWQLADYMGVDYPRIYQAGTTGNSNKTLELYSSGTIHRSVAILPVVEGTLSNMLLSFDVRTSAGTASSTGVVIVGTMGDITDQNSFEPLDTVYVSGTSFQKARFILSNYNLEYDQLAITSGLGANLVMSSDILIDNVELKDPSCIEPFDFKLNHPAPHSVDVTWKGVSDNDQWVVKLLKKSVTIAAIKNDTYDHSNDIVADSTVTGKAFYYDELAAQKNYYLYVRPTCDEDAWVAFDVYTTCELLDPTKANMETFESYSENTAPGCWTVGSTSSTASTIPYITTHLGSKILYLKQSSCTSWAATPEIKCDSLSSLMVTFYSGASLASEYCVFGVMTDPNDLSTFVALDSVKGEGSSAMLVKTSYDLSEYSHLIPATAKYIAWRGRKKTSDYVYLDDVSIISMACPMPKPSVSDLTTSSVRISGGLRTSDQWVLLLTDHYVSAENLGNDSYVVPEAWIIRRDTTDKASIRVSGLQGQTKYYVAAMTLCDDSVSSQWNTISFTTPCEAVTPEQFGTVTFSEDEGFTTGQGGETPCWTVGSKAENAPATYIPYVEATSGTMHNGKNYLKLNDNVSGSTSYVGSYAITPELNVDDITKYQVNFWGRAYNSTANNAQIIVGIITDPTDLSSFVALDTLNLSKTAWDPFSVGFENYMGDYMGDMGSHIMFLSEFGTTNQVYISEVSVDQIPLCRPISSFTVDSVGENAAVISWKGYQDSYRMLLANRELSDYEKPRYHYLLDTIVDHSDGILITGLEAAANYYVYAQGICDNGDSTAISMLYASIRTTCPTEGGAGLPFYDDFDSYETGTASPGCWQFHSSSSSYPQLSLISSSGTKAVELYTTSSYNSWMVAPKVEGELQNMLLSFDARAWSSSFTGTLYVGTMADPNDPSTFSLIASFPQNDASAFNHYTISLSDYEVMYDNLVFTSGFYTAMGLTSNSDVYVDNVSLEYLATCNPPRLTSAGSSFYSVAVDIKPAKREDERWQLVILPETEVALISNITAYLDTAAGIVVDSTHVVFTNLQPATTYYIYVRTLCEGEDVSAWSRNPLKMNTLYYYHDSYFFGFENMSGKAPESWVRSMYSESDDYYMHPALTVGQDGLGTETQSFIYYPHSRQNIADSISYSRTENGAMLMYAQEGYYGSYVIFPSIGVAHDRSFEFKVRPGYHDKKIDRIAHATEGLIEIGTVENGRGFDTYEQLASVRIAKPSTTTKPASKNNYLFTSYSLDLDSATIADKQLVLYMPKQPNDSAFLLFDDVTLGAAKGFSLVALKKIVADGESALVEWQNIGGPWNLYIETADGGAVQQFMNLSGVTSQVVDHLEPQTDYVARLERASAPAGAKNYVTNDHMAFRTLCQAQEPKNGDGRFVWNFDEDSEYELNDVLGGDVNDELYLKPSCFQTGITYDKPVNGYQWLVQRKGFEYYGPMTGYQSNRHYEAGMDDTHSLRVHTTDANYNSYIVLPELNCSLDTMMVEFYGRCFVNYDQTFGTVANRGKIVDDTYLNNAYSQSIVVGTLTDPKDLSTLHVVDTLTYSYTDLTVNDNVQNDPSGLHYWDLMQLPLAGTQGKYIVLFQPAPGLFYLDNLSVKPAGNTLFKPSHTETTNITATSATLNWHVWNPEVQSVVVVLNGMGEEILRETLLGTQYELTGLQASQMYSWYVYQIDGSNLSPSTKPLSFATECVVNTPAYTSSFEPEQGSQAIAGQKAYHQTLCWTYSDAIQGEWKNASYDPYNQPNTANFKYSYEGEHAVQLRASFSSRTASSYQPYIAMPAMDVAAYDTLQVMFWMRPAYVSAKTDSVVSTFTGSSYSKSIIVGTMTDPTNPATFMPLDTVTYDGTLSVADQATAGNNWLFQQMKVELVGATGPYVALMTSSREKGGTADKTGDYVWIDNVSFEHKQECQDPTDLTVLQLGSTHAVLNWNGVDSAGSFLVQVSTDPFFAKEDEMVFNQEVDANTCIVKGLKSQTTYVWRVQAICGERWGESSFSQKATFKTSRSPYFYEPFTTTVSSTEWTFSKSHADNVVDVPGGVIARGSDNGSFARTVVNYGLQGPHYVAPGHSTDYHWMITPNFYLPEDDSVHFSMDLAMTACNSAHLVTGNAVTENDMMDDYYFMVIISDDGGQTWKSENILGKWQNTNPAGQQLRDIPTNGMNVRFSLAQYAGKNVRIGLYREARSTSSTGVAIHVDNIRLAYFKKTVDYASACQFEDIQVGDIILSGEDTKPGIHAYPTCFFVSDADARAGVKDSVQQLEIEVYPAMESTFRDTICEGDTYANYDFLPKDRAGVYRRKLQTVEHGCDSIVTLYLYVKERRYAEDEEVAICPGESYMWNGNPYNRAGIFRDTIVSSIGCDSVMTLIVSYNASEDTLFEATRVELEELPFTYENAMHPYVAGQTPIMYPAGTPTGIYRDTVLVEGANCATVLVHTLTVYNKHEDIDNIYGTDGQGARKVIYHDQLYIILNDEWYNAAGVKVGDPRE